METIGKLPNKYWYQQTSLEFPSGHNTEASIKTNSNFKYITGILINQPIDFLETLISIKQNGRTIINPIPVNLLVGNTNNNYLKQFFSVLLEAEGKDVTLALIKDPDLEVDGLSVTLLHSNIKPTAYTPFNYLTKIISLNKEEKTERIILPVNDIEIITGFTVFDSYVYADLGAYISITDQRNYILKNFYYKNSPDYNNEFNSKFIPMSFLKSDLFLELSAKNSILTLVFVFQYLTKIAIHHERNPKLHTDHRKVIQHH